MLDYLKMKHAVVQAPMAGVSTPELAAAVCETGALGSVALGALDVEAAGDVITRTKALTSRPFSVNLFCHTPADRDLRREEAWLNRLRPEFVRYDASPPSELSEIYQSFRTNPAMLQVLTNAKPAAISFHFGLPELAQLAVLRQSGALLMATATSEAEGRVIAKAGLDVIVAQGWQAGGHRGMFDPDAEDEQLETLELVRRLSRLGLPIIAAGGIMTRQDAQKAIEAGATAVQCGTAFLRSPEAATSEAHREALNSGATRMTRTISGRPARCVENLFTQIDGSSAADYPMAYDAGKALNAAAVAKGEYGYGAFWSGTGAAMSVSRKAAETVAAISP